MSLLQQMSISMLQMWTSISLLFLWFLKKKMLPIKIWCPHSLEILYNYYCKLSPSIWYMFCPPYHFHFSFKWHNALLYYCNTDLVVGLFSKICSCILLSVSTFQVWKYAFLFSFLQFLSVHLLSPQIQCTI